MKTVDVCIPVYKPGEDLRKLLYRLCRQSYPVNCIRIVNTEEKFWKDAFLREPRRNGIPVELRHISKEEFDHGGTRNLMAAASDADLLLFMTQDAFPQNDQMIARMVEAFDDGRVVSAYARQLPKPGCAPLERQTRLFNYPAKAYKKSEEDISRLGIKTYFCSNVCAMYRRQAYEMLTGFSANTIFNEDMIFAHKVIQAGFSIAYAADARVFHSHNYTLAQYFRRSFDMAVSQAQHPEVFRHVSSEKEGMRLVRAVVTGLIKRGRVLEVIPFGFQCAAKYAGYFLGKRYADLPEGLVMACTDNKSFWKKA